MWLSYARFLLGTHAFALESNSATNARCVESACDRGHKAPYALYQLSCSIEIESLLVNSNCI